MVQDVEGSGSEPPGTPERRVAEVGTPGTDAQSPRFVAVRRSLSAQVESSGLTPTNPASQTEAVAAANQLRAAIGATPGSAVEREEQEMSKVRRTLMQAELEVRESFFFSLANSKCLNAVRAAGGEGRIAVAARGAGQCPRPRRQPRPQPCPTILYAPAGCG